MTECRGCKSRRLYLFLPLGQHPLANGFLRTEQLAEPEPLFPLDAHVCLDCGLIQVADNVPANFFRNYVYVPSTSDVMVRHFGEFAAEVHRRFATPQGALTVDIGCNDGLFLKSLKGRGARTLGVDPATNIIEMARREGLEIVNEYFNPEIARRIRDSHGPAAVITTTNTYHHIGNLDVFTEGVGLLLDGTGVFIVEVPHALELVEQNEFDGIYHEHVSQFTVKSFVDHYRRFGLEVSEIQHLDVHGGSVRVFARKAQGAPQVRPEISQWIAREEKRRLFSQETYDALRQRVERNRDTLLAMLREMKSAGKRLAGYGASARGNTLLNYFGIGPDLLDYVVDRNRLKQGLYSPGMHIPVHPVEKLAENPPDAVLLLAWNFADEILQQLKDYTARGGKFIVPIPEPRVIG
ncbi:MAG TPA: class I SAM-dependent methyltransferase [Candidatus Acidoferrales bacterium]